MKSDLDNPPISKQSVISLREITADTVREICRLKVNESQNQFVATNAESLAEANFYDKAWFRAIYADETPVGFVMTEENRKEGKFYIWRFMIDERYQRLGFGKKALAQVVDRIQNYPNAKEIFVGVILEEGGAKKFYQRCGFELTGEYEYGDPIMKLYLKENKSDANKTVGVTPTRSASSRTPL